MKGKKLTGAFVLIGLLIIVTIALAIQLNWYNFGNFSGTIQPSGVNIVNATLNMGTVSSGANFEVTDNTTVAIPSNANNGLLFSKLFFIAPGSISSSRDYMEERFGQLNLNITYYNQSSYDTISLIIVKNSVLQSWSWVDSTGGNSWWISNAWPNNVFLQTGVHEIQMKAYGTTASPSVALTIDIDFAMELT